MLPSYPPPPALKVFIVPLCDGGALLRRHARTDVSPDPSVTGDSGKAEEINTTKYSVARI